jgi:hypothetical protein
MRTDRYADYEGITVIAKKGRSSLPRAVNNDDTSSGLGFDAVDDRHVVRSSQTWLDGSSSDDKV